jgi:hypothetical protein
LTGSEEFLRQTSASVSRLGLAKNIEEKKAYDDASFEMSPARAARVTIESAHAIIFTLSVEISS